MKQKKGLFLVYVNIRSIFHKIDLLRLDLLDNFFDFVGVGEIWMKPSLPSSLICSEYYNLVRKDRDVNNKKGGGICLFIKLGIVYEELKLNDFQISGSDLEWLCVKANIGGHKTQIILCIYRPPGGKGSVVMEWFRSFLDFVTDNYRNAELTVMGDFNFNYMNLNCPHVKSLKMMEQLYGMNQIISEPTRSTRHCSTLIDLCFTNMSNIQSSGIINYNLSDH